MNFQTTNGFLDIFHKFFLHWFMEQQNSYKNSSGSSVLQFKTPLGFDGRPDIPFRSHTQHWQCLGYWPRVESVDQPRESMEGEFVGPLSLHIIPEKTSWIWPQMLHHALNPNTSIILERQRGLRSTMTSANKIL